MPELNLKQITDKLNTEFAGDTRKLVFWYDDKAEFADDIIHWNWWTPRFISWNRITIWRILFYTRSNFLLIVPLCWW